MINSLDLVREVVKGTSSSVAARLGVSEDTILKILKDNEISGDNYSSYYNEDMLGITLDGFLFLIMMLDTVEARALKKKCIDAFRFLGQELSLRQKSSSLVSDVHDEILGEAHTIGKESCVEYNFKDYNHFVYISLKGKAVYHLKKEYHLSTTHYLRERFTLQEVRGLQYREERIMYHLIRLDGIGLSQDDLYNEVMMSVKIQGC